MRKSKVLPKKLIDRRLQEALTEVKAGKIIGPFVTLADGLKVLKRAT